MNANAKTKKSSPKARRDYRAVTIALIVLGCAILGSLIQLLPGKGVSSSPIAKESTSNSDFSSLQVNPDNNQAAVKEELAVTSEQTNNKTEPLTSEQKAVQAILELAQEQISNKEYDLAIATLHVARLKLKQDPVAYLNMGQALEGQKNYDVARDFYNKAADMDPLLSDAYFGFATASEALGDLESAIGGMRNFLHVQPNADPGQLKIAQARSAIWEWESQLGRGLWGPTKGVPPGLTAEQIKRDGLGVATIMPMPDSEDEHGKMQFEIKHRDKKEVFKE